ncbi:MAG: PAS domain-containing protein [Clostridia bacterium]|nr:PAS domain-containing protein [Clostridia bacterium]
MAFSLALKKSNCKNCYKCIRHCPVKSIKFSGNQAHISEDECILCGHCFVVCPQNAKEIVDETEKVKVLLKSGEKIIVSLAPSFVANYDGVGINSMRTALTRLGFFEVEETAIGATIVKKEYEEMLDREERDVIISSCCHSINLLIQKYFPAELKCLADVMSPMQAHCADIKKRYPGARTVFIGPCVAKKDEAQRYPGIVDAVLTFEELTRMLREKNIVPEREKDSSEESLARIFPTAGGVIKTLLNKNEHYTYMAIDGVENCITALKDIEHGNLHKCFIEMNACVGSCIGGPVMEKYHNSPVSGYAAVDRYAGKKDFNVDYYGEDELKKDFLPIDLNEKTPTEDEIRAILKQMGKISVMDELNCGTCGYDTCREKAIAIYRGKAEVSMCLPYLKERAESFSDTVLNNTPNGIIVLNEDFEVQQINKAARKMLNIRSASDVMGEPVIRIFDPKVFIETKTSGKSVRDRKIYLAEYDRYIELTTVYDREYHNILGIMKDITDFERDKQKKEEISRQTLEVTDKVVDKQMRIVQEIASLLGETAAETKIALSKLKETIENE